MMDPIGLSLENFDSIGTYRAGENDMAIDASGEIDGVKFTNAEGLGKAIHESSGGAGLSGQSALCLCRRPYADQKRDEWLRSDLAKSFAADGYRLRPLMRRIATSDVFFRVLTPDSEVKPTRSAALGN